MARGFYSVVQYVPDRSRAEAVNLGLVLFCQDTCVLRFRFLTDFNRVKSLFFVNEANLKFSVQSMHARLECLAATIRTIDELITFAASRGNDICITEPRFAKLQNINDDFERLFLLLVLPPTNSDDPVEFIKINDVRFINDK